MKSNLTIRYFLKARVLVEVRDRIYIYMYLPSLSGVRCDFVSFFFILTGEDPLADVTDSTSINSIAGVLKSFFRELQEPLFPLTLFDAFVDANSKLFCV